MTPAARDINASLSPRGRVYLRTLSTFQLLELVLGVYRCNWLITDSIRRDRFFRSRDFPAARE